MSENDMVQIIWKTKDRWRDTEHWTKRRDIKPVNHGCSSKDYYKSMCLKASDEIKVKFGSRWYNAECAQEWSTDVLGKGNYLNNSVMVGATNETLTIFPSLSPR